MLDEHLAGHSLAVGETGEGWAILDISNPNESNILHHKRMQLEAYKASLGICGDIIFQIAMGVD